jgi:diadenosine tetraphosphate (Ap4A) HIT family hydrolase
MNDSRYPWFVLVPQRAEISEIFQLAKPDRDLLIDESCYLAMHLSELYQADKMNVAAIGNLVPQLHIHHVVRYKNDCAWPAPVWGRFSAISYTDQEVMDHLRRVQAKLATYLRSID